MDLFLLGFFIGIFATGSTMLIVYYSRIIRFRHCKGGSYRYICDATLEWCPDDPNSHVIIYKSEQTGRNWVRPKKHFLGYVNKSNGKTIRRFERIK